MNEENPMLKSIVKVVEIKKPETEAQPANRVFCRPQSAQGNRPAHSRRAKRFGRSLPRMSAQSFVDSFADGPAAAAKVGANIAAGIEKALKEGDIAEFSSVKSLKKSLGFWQSVAGYGAKKAETNKKR